MFLHEETQGRTKTRFNDPMSTTSRAHGHDPPIDQLTRAYIPHRQQFFAGNQGGFRLCGDHLHCCPSWQLSSHSPAPGSTPVGAQPLPLPPLLICSPSACSTFSAVIGSEVMRTPTASSMALAIAGAMASIGGSPMPRAPNG